VVIVPLLAALAIPLAARGSPGRAWGLACAALAFTLVAAGMLLARVQGLPAGGIRYALGGWAAPTGIEYVVDRLNAFVLVMVATAGLAAAVWMRPGLGREVRREAQVSWWAVYLLLVTGLLGIAITGDVFNLYVFLEIASITSYVLVAMGRSRRALYAGYSYLIVGSLGATFILLGIGHLYMATGSLAMADIAALLPERFDAHRSVVLTSLAFFTVGLGIKMALFPLHGWQPSAYAEAPSGISLFLAATATKVSAYAFYRLVFGVYGEDFLLRHVPVLRYGVLAMAASAMVVGPLLAIRQNDLKRLLAYSSVGQIGFVMLGVALLDRDGVAGSVLHFWNHAAAKGALFGAAGLLVLRTGASRVADLAGLGRHAPWTAVAVTLAAASLVGIPLTGGFLTKLHLARGALAADLGLVVPVLVVSSLLTLAYAWRIVQLAWFADATVRPAVEADAPWAMRGPCVALGAACLLVGVSPWALDLARGAARALVG
jgi:multicomponent Na+:H+ antiporter subunit D